MQVTLEEVQKINRVQIETLRQAVRVCDELNIRFYMVHGSLLGTIRVGGFLPYDDDIDIAMKRADYERFLREAPKRLPKDYFVQSLSSDRNYPLLFAKIRDSRTTYVCESVKFVDMHHGIYIDVFPIDNARIHETRLQRLQYKLLSLRISASLYLPAESGWQRGRKRIARLLVPSLSAAIRRREKIVKSQPQSEWISLTGGKPAEQVMPAAWFEDTEQKCFEGIPVWVPKQYDAYLRRIYGDYETRTLVEGKMQGDRVTLNACAVNTEQSYLYADVNQEAIPSWEA